MEFSFQALGTTWWIEIWDEVTDTTRAEITDFCSSFVTEYEQNYSRFKSDSVVSQLNHERVLKNPSDELKQLLSYGKQLYLRTDGIFNFLTGHIIEARGYDANYSFIDTGTAKLHPGNPITDLTIAPERIELNHGNIDIGGYGKGYLIDLLAKQFKTTFRLEQFLISGGGDMFATHHNGEAVEIHLEHPINQGELIAPTRLFNQGFAASSPHRRVWQNSTGTHHHIISDTVTSDGTYIKAATAADADAFATTILQLDKQQIENLAQQENLAVARFNTLGSLLTKTRNFD